MQFQIDFIGSKGRVFSKNLDRWVRFRFVAPPDYGKSNKPFPVLLMNDGQDFIPMNLEATLTKAYLTRGMGPFVYVGIECNENRIREYGTASSADFKGRGDRAKRYSKFVMEEFVPFLKKEFKISSKSEDWVYCGMSLGGLSAFDIVYNNPESFGKVGVFSGSFWWRKKAYIKADLADRSRIILDVIKNRPYAPHLKFWFECGTEDELADRNNNGIIDAIDDTMDVIKELRAKGYLDPEAIKYVEVKGGKHNLPTWGAVFPDFIEWAFRKGIRS